MHYVYVLDFDLILLSIGLFGWLYDGKLTITDGTLLL